jgi:hypothetical protein
MDIDVVSDTATFEVVDPAGYWFDPRQWTCDGAIVDFDPITANEENLAAAALGWFGIDPDGQDHRVSPVGYADSQSRQGYAVFDDSEAADPFGIMWFEPQGERWISVDVRFC